MSTTAPRRRPLGAGPGAPAAVSGEPDGTRLRPDPTDAAEPSGGDAPPPASEPPTRPREPEPTDAAAPGGDAPPPAPDPTDAAEPSGGDAPPPASEPPTRPREPEPTDAAAPGGDAPPPAPDPTDAAEPSGGDAAFPGPATVPGAPAPPRRESPHGAAPRADAPLAVPQPPTRPRESGRPDAGESPGGEATPLPGPEAAEEPDDGRFKVVLANFEGPFDLLLQLISRHKLDVTEVALSRVTDEFMAHLRAMGPDWDLDQTTEFLVVAATLLDLKAARLLPTAEVEDEADLALLEARDLLFARLLQYRAYKRVADIFNERLAAEALRHPRTVGLEPHHAALLPDVVISIGAEGFARLAVKAMQPKPKPQVYIDHIHAPLVSVREQAEIVIGRLRELKEATFAELTGDAPDTLTVVARFLALLELYRERAVTLDQDEALGPLIIRWSGAEPGRALVTDEFDQDITPEPEEA
ncbi:segregation/condensation protein A [Streptomyces sp. NBC_01803]|uniref:segregation/condensation protein A n=1 Tax=Streptomyces sp. NBC_01803 TaxID=2975946 RepID=UPI002DDB0121|nr:segregation/condensation protein A [Streptomyces sp. NBC_01803]WSA46886.1 segregation/condensation protein A [Streptomyces sp. NBC_01803]